MLNVVFILICLFSAAKAHNEGRQNHDLHLPQYLLNPFLSRSSKKWTGRDEKPSKELHDHSDPFEKEEIKLEKHFSKDFFHVLADYMHKYKSGLANEILRELLLKGKTTQKHDQTTLNSENRTKVIPLENSRTKYYDWVKQFNSSQCGHQDIQPSWMKFRIIGGRETIPGSWPWMASMLFDMVGTHWCAASLIAPQWIVTARHCFDFPFNLTDHWRIRLGKYDISQEDELTEQDYRIKGLIGHPLYNPRDFDNDIALIQLDRPVNLTRFVSPICLGSEAPVENQECVATGWGKISETDTHFSDILMQVALPIMNHDACAELYENLTTNTLCAGLFRGGLDSCQGDSGGPLQCQVDGKWYIDGITSWGGRHYVECGRPNQPGVYTRLSNYRTWIYRQIYRHSERTSTTE